MVNEAAEEYNPSRESPAAFQLLKRTPIELKRSFRLRTLLIQSDCSTLDQLGPILRSRGHEVIRIDQSDLALAAIAAQPFDLLIVDLAVPGIRFRDFTETLRTAPWGGWCETLVVSASDRRQDIDDAVRSGADDYLIPTEDLELLSVRLAVAERRAKDNAARRRMMSALTASEDRFRDLLETAPDAIFRVGVDGRIQLVNGNAERMSGYSREELIGQPIEILVPEAIRGPHVAYRQSFARNPATRPMGSRANLNLQRKDGSEVPIDICLGHHRSSDQEYTIAAVRDVTERRRLEHELRLAKEAAEHAYERIRRDMEAAARLQRALLPSASPDAPGVEFAWEYQPCAGLAGDGLNVFLLDEDHVGLYLLDVSGHGVGAALLSVTLARMLSPAMSQSSFLRDRLLDQDGLRIVPPAEVARRLNDWFLANPAGEQYFTLLYGVLELRTQRLRFISAGHSGLIHCAGSKPTLLRIPGFPIGCMEEAEYEESHLQLRPGDRLFLYSDGVSDAANSAGELFGDERVLQSVESIASETIQQGTRHLLQTVLQWADGEPQDDLSVLAVSIE